MITYYINSFVRTEDISFYDTQRENSVDITQLSVYVFRNNRTHLEQGISHGEIAVLYPS